MEHVDNKDASEREPAGRGESSPLPVSSPVSEFLASGAGLLEGRLDEEIFRNRLISERERFDRIYDRFLQIYTGGGITERIKEEMDRVYSSFWYYGKTLEEMESFFETHDRQIIESGLATLDSCVNTAAASYQAFLTIQSTQDTKTCPHCKSTCALGALSCEPCGSTFALTDEEIPLEFASLFKKSKALVRASGALPLAGSLIELYLFFVRYLSGRFPKERLIEYIDWLTTQCELTWRRMEREQYSKPPEQLQYEDLRSTELLFDALDSAKKALDKLHDRIILDTHRDLSKEWNSLIQAIHLIFQSQIGDDKEDRPE